jgi:hypothetical protein
MRAARRALHRQLQAVHNATAARPLERGDPDPVIADAIRDRLEHAALTLHITSESYLGVKARKLATGLLWLSPRSRSA